MAGAQAQPLLWLRLAQACLGGVHRARGCWQATASPDSPQGEAEAQQLMLAGCCLQNARLLLDRPPPERSGAAAEQQQHGPIHGDAWRVAADLKGGRPLVGARAAE